MKKPFCVILALFMLVWFVGGCEKMEAPVDENGIISYAPTEDLRTPLPNESDGNNITPSPTLPGVLMNNPVLEYEGKQLSGINVSIVKRPYSAKDFDSVILPFTVVLKVLGYSVQWENKHEAVIRIHGGQPTSATYYILSLSEKTLCRKGTDYNILLPPPGNTYYYCEVINQELYLDWETLAGTLATVGVRIRKRVEMEKEYIVITRVLI